jgi:hypothetical protein
MKENGLLFQGRSAVGGISWRIRKMIIPSLRVA